MSLIDEVEKLGNSTAELMIEDADKNKKAVIQNGLKQGMLATELAAKSKKLLENLETLIATPDSINTEIFDYITKAIKEFNDE